MVSVDRAPWMSDAGYASACAASVRAALRRQHKRRVRLIAAAMVTALLAAVNGWLWSVDYARSVPTGYLMPVLRGYFGLLMLGAVASWSLHMRRGVQHQSEVGREIMDEQKQVVVTATMPADVAFQLAQLCKRVSFATALDYTEAHLPAGERTQRAYQMLAGMDAIAAGLREAGFSPR